MILIISLDGEIVRNSYSGRRNTRVYKIGHFSVNKKVAATKEIIIKEFSFRYF